MDEKKDALASTELRDKGRTCPKCGGIIWESPAGDICDCKSDEFEESQDPQDLLDAGGDASENKTYEVFVTEITTYVVLARSRKRAIKIATGKSPKPDEDMITDRESVVTAVWAQRRW